MIGPGRRAVQAGALTIRLFTIEIIDDLTEILFS